MNGHMNEQMTTEKPPVLIESLENAVLTLTMNRPERLNALTPPLLMSLLQALRKASLNPQVRAVVLTGAGRAFCAGGDVKEMAAAGVSVQTLEERAAHLREAMDSARLLREMPKPTIALARGPVMGAGFSLALACDILVVSDSVKISTSFISVGLSSDYGGNWLLAQRVGARARWLSMLSPVLSAEEAARAGIADMVVPDAELETEGNRLASQLASAPTLAIGHTKANLNAVESGVTLGRAMDDEALRQMRCVMTEDHREAAAAFVEKRAPRFAGR